MNLKLGCGQSLRYDMSGGAWEYVMGVLAYYESPYLPMSGYSIGYNSGFTGKVYENGSYADFNHLSPIDAKYYNLYKIATSKEGMPTSSDIKNSNRACNGEMCYGEALIETAGWYGDSAGFVRCEFPWSTRGAYNGNTTNAGVFSSDSAYGHSNGNSSRFILTP